MSRPFREVFLLGLFVVIAVSANCAFAGDSQPAVAIKKPVIGENVSKYTKKYLDVSALWAEMESSFRATRKLRVVTRNIATMEAIREEQQFAESDLAKGDAAETGSLSNAHYLIIPTIQDFKFYRSHKALPNFDSKYRRQDSGSLQVSAQMVDTTSGQIVTTFFMKSSFAGKSQIVNGKGGMPSSSNFTRMAKKVSAQLADQFISAVFPMKVVKRTRTNQIVLNRGKDGGLKIGEKYDVFFAGEEMIDPDTGESLGSSEELVGKIEIVRINPKVTYTKIVSELDPENAPIGPGDIVRKPQ